MANAARSTTRVGLGTKTPPANTRIAGDMYAGEKIYKGDACYIKSDGSIWRSVGTAVAPAAKARGISPETYEVGEAMTLYKDINFGYADGTLTPGQDLYVSTTPGLLSDTATTGGTAPVAYAVDTYRIYFHGSRY